MSRRKPAISDLNIRSEQPTKRFKSSPTSLHSSPYRNIFEQFDDVAPSQPLPTKTEHAVKGIVAKVSSQLSSSTSSSTARSIMAKTTKTQENDQLWSTLFQPKTRADLVIHPKKVKELEDLLQKSCEIVKSNHRPSKLIVLSGPSGSGKSICLRVLAAALNINLVEWETRTTSAITSTALDGERDDRYSIESQKRSFRTFVFQSTRYLTSSTGRSNEGFLFDNDDAEPKKPGAASNKQLVLIEDLPNGFYSDVGSFHSTLRELKRVAHHPVVFVLTDNSSLSAANNPQLLFPLSIIDELKIEQIGFNSIALTFMKRALECVINEATLLNLKPPSRRCIAETIQVANGDLRLAINTLQFSGNSQVKSSTTTSTAKDACLSLFQALGRILYQKDSEENVNDHTKMYPENLIEQCHISAPTFVGFLFENYLDFYSSMVDAADVCQYLSLTDQINHEWETRLQLASVSSSIACRAVRLCNSTPAQRGFRPMRKPQDNDVQARVQKNRTLLKTNKLYYGCSDEEYFTHILPYQAYLLKSTRSSTTNATNSAILDIGFINRYSRKCPDVNSMVTFKNSSIAVHSDHQHSANEILFNFSMIHANTTQLNQLEYDDQVEIETIDD